MTPEQRARNEEKLRQALKSVKSVSGKMAIASAKSCAIPLLNATPRNAQANDRPMILPAPPNTGAFAIRQISPPAPPCDDVKR